jgi:hypothetical protein
MIGETAYENKPGGRKLGTIVGQRVTKGAGGRPAGQWEIRSGRGVKFFMLKAEVRTESQPEPEHAPVPPPTAAPTEAAAPAPPPGSAPPPAEALAWRIEEDLARHRSAVPVVVTVIGVAFCAASAVLFVLGVPQTLSVEYAPIVGIIPALIGLLIILIGTNLVGEQDKRLARRREKLMKDAQRRPREGPR